MNDEAIRSLVRRAQAIDPEPDANEHYIRIRAGSAKKAAATIASKIPVAGREPGEVVAQILEVLAATDGEESKGYVEVLAHGASEVLDGCTVRLVENDMRDPAQWAGKGSEVAVVGMAAQMARMAENADRRAENAQSLVMETIARAQVAETAVALAQVEKVIDPRWEALITQVGPVLPHLAIGVARKLGVPVPGGRPPQPAPKALPEPQAAEKGQAPEPVPEPLDARAEALAAINRLRELRRNNPQLVEDQEIGSGIGALIFGDDEGGK